MPNLPAFCDNCGTVFPSGFAVTGQGTMNVMDCKSGPCPTCGAMGRVPDGSYKAFNDILALVAAPAATLLEFRNLQSIFAKAVIANQSVEELSGAIKEDAPEFSTLAEYFKAYRTTDIYPLIQIILTALTIIITLYSSQCSNLSSSEIEEIKEKTLEQPIKPPDSDDSTPTDYA